MSTPLKTNEYITLYDLRGPWAEESAKKIILQRINTKIDTIIKEKDKEREEAVAAARSVSCGEAKTEAHHEDYTKPLEIVWLCRKHHVALHHKRPNVVTPPTN